VAIFVLGCFDYSSALTIKRKSLRKTVEEMGLQVNAGAERNERADGAIADIGADLDVIRQDLTTFNGQLEEKVFDMEQLRENIDLLSQTLQRLEERIKTLETPSQDSLSKEIEEALKKEEQEKAQAELLTSLKTAIEALTIRVDAIDGLDEDNATEDTSTKKDSTIKNTYMTGLDLVRVKKDYTKALIVFKDFLKENPKHELSDNARYWIGEIYYVRGEFGKAVLEFNKVIKNHPGGDKVAAAILKQSYSFEKLGSTKEAGMLLRKVIKKYPDSTEAEIAKEHLENLKKKKETIKPVKATKPEKAATPEKAAIPTKATKPTKASAPAKAVGAE